MVQIILYRYLHMPLHSQSHSCNGMGFSVAAHHYAQISATVYPSGKGSVGCATTWQYCVIQAEPEISGTTATFESALQLSWPFSIGTSSISFPTNLLPTMLSWINSSPILSSPRA